MVPGRGAAGPLAGAGGVLIGINTSAVVAAGLGTVALPDALAMKYPNAPSVSPTACVP
jgi:hypothetical protein